MFALLIGLIGFFTASSEVLGASLIVAFSWMNTWFCIIGGIIFVIWVIIALIGTVLGAAAGDDITSSKTGLLLGAITGAGGSILIGALLFIKIGLLIFLSSYLMTTIDPTIIGFAMLTTKQMVAAAAVVLIPILFRSRKTKRDE